MLSCIRLIERRWRQKNDKGMRPLAEGPECIDDRYPDLVEQATNRRMLPHDYEARL